MYDSRSTFNCVSVRAVKSPTPEQHLTEAQQKRVDKLAERLAELKRLQEEVDRESDELQEARKREYERTPRPTLTTGPTFWFKHAWWIMIFGIFALGVLINWITDGEFITWLEPSR